VRIAQEKRPVSADDDEEEDADGIVKTVLRDMRKSDRGMSEKVGRGNDRKRKTREAGI